MTCEICDDAPPVCRHTHPDATPSEVGLLRRIEAMARMYQRVRDERDEALLLIRFLRARVPADVKWAEWKVAEAKEQARQEAEPSGNAPALSE